MSHISKIELEVKDLAVLRQACERLGLTFMENQQSFKWFGSEAGACNHAIRIPEAEYEIGIIQRNGRYELECDFFDSRIEDAVGKDGGYLKQAYAVEKVKLEARRKGYYAIEQKHKNAIRITVRAA